MRIRSAKKEICASNVWLHCGLCPAKNLSSFSLQGKTNKYKKTRQNKKNKKRQKKKQRGLKEEFKSPEHSRMLLYSLYQA